MPTVALLSGLAALVAGAVKYGVDAYRAKRSPQVLSVSIGDQSIQVPSSFTPDQVAALVAALKDKTAVGQQSK